MPMPMLEEVFKLSGVPTHTFVEPIEYQELVVSLRTPGRGLVLEGPSGIGKTTGVEKALEELGLSPRALKLSARRADDVEMIAELPGMKDIGIVIVDDFHRLDEQVKMSIADYMKTLADRETPDSKVIVVGINKAGDSLVKFASDLNNRIDTIRFEANPPERIGQLIQQGEDALNIRINTKSEIAIDAQGSFHLAQMLCHRICLAERTTERQESERAIEVSLEVVKSHVLDDLSRAFFETAREFAMGPRFRREGRGPYLHILRWLAESEEWSIQLNQAMSNHPEHRGSVGQVVDKGFLSTFLDQSKFAAVLHFDEQTRVLSAEDPKFIYYLRNLIWPKFARQVGFVNVRFDARYDFALSFARPDRNIAEELAERLMERELSVFYDKNEQHRILAENVEDYLAPIYRSEAEFVIALLGPEYPERIWTKFESDQFKQRFGANSVIPIWFDDAPLGIFDRSKDVGGLDYQRSGDQTSQLNEICEQLVRKIVDDRTTSRD